MFITTDYVRAGSGKIKVSGNDELPMEKLLNVFEQACVNEPFSLDGLKLPSEEHAEQLSDSGQPSAATKETTEARGDKAAEVISGYETIRIKPCETCLAAKDQRIEELDDENTRLTEDYEEQIKELREMT